MPKISERHFKRLKKNFRKFGLQALIHGNCGRTPPNAYSEETKQKVLRSSAPNTAISTSHISPISLKEEHGIKVSRETMRSWLIKAASLNLNPLNKNEEKGALDQKKKDSSSSWMDPSMCGSVKKQFTLLLALDDATGKALGGLFAPRETVLGAFLGISTWIAIPSSLPLDTKGFMLSNWPKSPLPFKCHG